ncbi:hypothetical protein IMSAGC004_01603 [Bacteroidaceae bacterium]|nr:hypothetical protein IMSAGC004_01603 [Bacteroidaceae bacterium]
MAARNGRTGVPTGNRSDHHTFPCTKPTRIVQYSNKPVHSRTKLWLLLPYKRKFFGQITASDTPLLRIEVIGPIANVLGKSQGNIFIS